MLSFTRGEPIALIKGGKRDNTTIYYYDPTKKCCAKCSSLCGQKRKKCCDKCEVKSGGCGSCGGELQPDIEMENPLEALGRDFWKGRRKLKPFEMEALREGLRRRMDPIGAGIEEETYRDARQRVDQQQRYEITAGLDETIVPHPRTGAREICYVSAPSGAGKSTYCANYAKEYNYMFPDNDIFVFSRLQEDKALDDIPNMERIPIDEKLLEHPIDPAQKLKDCLVIFDDIDTLRDKELKKEVQHLRNDIMEIGRHPSTYCLATSHMMMNFQETRGLINEAHTVTMFPQFTPYHHMHRYLTIYGGLNKKQIKKVLKIPSRWVTISQKGPRYLLHEKGVTLLNHIEEDDEPEQKRTRATLGRPLRALERPMKRTSQPIVADDDEETIESSPRSGPVQQRRPRPGRQ
jgi:hypothetical protein